MQTSRYASLSRLLLTCVFLLPSGVSAGRKHPDLEVLEFKAERAEDLISIHAKVKNIGDHKLQRVNLIFRFLDTADATVTTQRTELDTAELGVGQESEIDAQMRDSPRAVRVIVLADRSGGVETRVSSSGPYTVE